MSSERSEEPGQSLDLADAGQAGVYFVTDVDLDVLQAAARDAGIAVVRIDLGDCRGKDDLLVAIARAFQFPAGMGGNWDALADALSDLGWLPPALARAALIEQAGQLLDADQAAFDTLVEILEDTSADWREAGTPFWAFLALPELEFGEEDGGSALAPPQALH